MQFVAGCVGGFQVPITFLGRKMAAHHRLMLLAVASFVTYTVLRLSKRTEYLPISFSDNTNMTSPILELSNETLYIQQRNTAYRAMTGPTTVPHISISRVTEHASSISLAAPREGRPAWRTRYEPVSTIRAPSKKCDICSVYDTSANIVLNTECVRMKNVSLHVCIHPPSSDIYVSKQLKELGIWEENITLSWAAWLGNNPDMGVIDLGANIGVYSLIALSLGHRVLAVEPNIENIHQLHRSVQLGNFQNLTVLNNAVGDQRGVLEFDLNPRNQGAGTLNRLNKSDADIMTHRKVKVNAVLMDDLTKFVTFERAIMKVDIEGFEHRAFVHADRLFNRVDISLVVMEWKCLKNYLRRPDNDVDHILVRDMVDFFLERGYVPKGRFQRTLHFRDWESWPADIQWMK